jgi:tRNA(fMet)-specific endonuclease VapC
MKQAILDTDTLSFCFRNNIEATFKINQYLDEFGFINISVITYYEILHGLYYKDARKQLKFFEKFIELSVILPVTFEIAQKSAQIYANLRNNGLVIGHNDVMIAGTAILNDMTLITNNVKHFSRIEHLEIDNWVGKEE